MSFEWKLAARKGGGSERRNSRPGFIKWLGFKRGGRDWVRASILRLCPTAKRYLVDQKTTFNWFQHSSVNMAVPHPGLGQGTRSNSHTSAWGVGGGFQWETQCSQFPRLVWPQHATERPPTKVPVIITGVFQRWRRHSFYLECLGNIVGLLRNSGDILVWWANTNLRQWLILKVLKFHFPASTTL